MDFIETIAWLAGPALLATTLVSVWSVRLDVRKARRRGRACARERSPRDGHTAPGAQAASREAPRDAGEAR